MIKFTEISKKAIKEFFRVSLIGAIPTVIDGLSKGIIDWRLVGITFTISFLKAVDKFLHEAGKETKNKTLITGLVRF